MYLHLGQGVVIPRKDIIGIFDIDECSRSVKTRNFLTAAEQENRMKIVGDDIPKSFTVVDENGKSMIYLSQISAATLLRRSSLPMFE